MAELFIKQAKQYAAGRPNYPAQLFNFISSKTPFHDLVWDVGTGSGQAAASLSTMYKNVIATDTSPKQLDCAPKISNVSYQLTSPTMSTHELERDVASESTVDLVTVAQAMHWFDMPEFYKHVKYVLKKPQGVIAAWCYTTPEVDDSVDAVFQPFYRVACGPYWDPLRKLVDDKYTSIEFPFEPVDGADDTGPFEFVTEKRMDLDAYLTYLKSWSAYQTAKGNGVELLTDDVVNKFRCAWGLEDNNNNNNSNNNDNSKSKVVRFPIYLRIGKVGKE